jgi:ribosomal protein L44E
MPEHYTKNTLECTAWCGKCHRQTQHRVDNGRRGPCLECLGFIIGACHFPEQPKCFHCGAPFAQDSKTEASADSVIVFCRRCGCMTPFQIDHEAAMSKKQLAAKRKREQQRQNPGLFE